MFFFYNNISILRIWDKNSIFYSMFLEKVKQNIIIKEDFMYYCFDNMNCISYIIEQIYYHVYLVFPMNQYKNLYL